MRKKSDTEKHFDEALTALYKKDVEEFIDVFYSFGDLLNFADRDGRTLLFYAVLENNLDIVKLLIKEGANLNVKDKLGWSPLHYAINEHNPEMVKLLITNGAKINVKDSFGNTPIWRAVFASKGRGDIIELLLLNGADPAIKNNSGISAIDLAKTIANYDVKQFFPEFDSLK